MKKLLFRKLAVVTLDEAAEALGGEVDGEFVICPSPGFPSTDRSCWVRINPSRPEDLFIYHARGKASVAYAHVRAILGILDSKTASKEDAALRIWNETVPAADTLVERYLRSRRINLPIPPSIRFHPNLTHRSGSSWPAMVGGIARGNCITAVHRTYLARDGEGKAPISPVKMTLGCVTGAGLQLGLQAEEIVVAEGIETTLSVMQSTGLSGCAALSASGLSALRLPQIVASVLIAADGDKPGQAAARAAANRFILEGRRARIAFAPAGKDFNDLVAGGQGA